jgi:hypothetical protein
LTPTGPVKRFNQLATGMLDVLKMTGGRAERRRSIQL